MLGALGGGGIGSSLGGAIGGIAVLAGAGGKGGSKYYREALKVWQKLQDPAYDMRDLTPPELQIMAEYFPETYDAVVPEGVREIVEDPAMREAQVRGMSRFERVAEEGLPVSERLAVQQAQQGVATEAQRAQQSILRDLAERGQLGGSEEITARLGANQQAMNLAGQMGTDIAREEIMQRLAASGQAANMAGQIRSQDANVQGRNADYVNRYNELVAQMRTQAASDAAGARERAQFQNVGTKQRTGEENVLNRYRTQLENVNRKNQLREALSGFQLRKAEGLSGAFQARGLQKDQDKAAREQAIMSIGKGVGGLAGAGLGGGGLI